MAYRIEISHDGAGNLILTPTGSRGEGREVIPNQRHRVFRKQHVEWISNGGPICITFNPRVGSPDPFDGGVKPEQIMLTATTGKETQALKVKDGNYDGIPLKYWVALFVGHNKYIWDPELEDGGDPPPPPPTEK